jgi:uncharacterized protein (TIGR00725 family)
VHTVIGVMGGAVADDATFERARVLGRLVAKQGWTLLNGGRNAGVMASSAAGAHEAGGLVVGILPDDDRSRAAPDIDIAIPTGLGDARNAVNVLASDVVVALPGGAGTLSEISLALKAGRPVVALGFPLGATFQQYYDSGGLVDAATPEEAVSLAKRLLGERRPA